MSGFVIPVTGYVLIMSGFVLNVNGYWILSQVSLSIAMARYVCLLVCPHAVTFNGVE